ncbi:cell division protein FtsW [Helicobacter cholecystus]|uniref:Probable peptidoglycan glycosyltransferase FtsW n=1 Tax=Helicobacter cholecystus TaxID=45498 RepID=A0A3D8IW53_9HELI|nr:FtsW/RodA/SpoVE family cell cycle protein [Helicobacter cholecystus]RDU69519.1 cell division protein FtsW [Helicobacter cholecystus]VEJ24072.1 cell division protein FtsW [Helicobacter cholecystus]
MQKTIFYSSVILLCFGIVMVYSLSTYTVLIYDVRSDHFMSKQCISALVAILLMWLISQLNIDCWFKILKNLLFFLSFFAILAIPFLPESLATNAGGAQRWIRLFGFSIAPLEFFKIGFIMFLSDNLSRNYKPHPSIKDELESLFPILLAIIVGFLCVVWSQNDFGQVAVMSISFCVMLLFAGGSKKLLGLFATLALIGFVLIITWASRRVERIKIWWASAQNVVIDKMPFLSFLKVEDMPEPYQIYHAGNAIHHGGWLGSGIGGGVVKLGFLSEVHTDMVLAGIAEEFGFFGILGVLGLFLFGVIYPILKIANRVQNQMYSLYCVGIACLLSFAFFINALGVTGVIPIKGIAVPFLSYGGSSLVCVGLALGIVLAISKKIARPSA